LTVFGVGVFGLKDYALARWFWLVPLRDLITFAIWVISFAGNEVEWRGVNFRVRSDGKLIPSGKT
jgi:ceramide glucosyltransferase